MTLNVHRAIIVIIAAFITLAFILAPMQMFATAGNSNLPNGPTRPTGPSGPNGPTRPTVENALAADKELTRALRENDTAGIVRMLDKDWAVITTRGGIGEGPGLFPAGIRSGYRTLKTMELSEARVRLFGDAAVVTTKVRMSGMFAGKPFDIVERQTDVFRWEDIGWKCILTHETKLEE